MSAFLFISIDANLANAICKTLLHSLWEGFVLATLAGCVLQLTTTKMPVVRYNLLLGLLATFLVSIACTFCLVYNSNPVAAFVGTIATVTFAAPDEGGTTLNRVNNLINLYSGQIVICWFMLVFIQVCRMAGGFFYINRLRSQSGSVPDYWQEKINKLSFIMKISRPVGFQMSNLTRIPLMIGHFKPIIFVPAALFTALTEDQIESILLHELAHIKRNDYFVNLVQGFTDALFFFNPGVLWVSNLLRTERENCCDQMVVDQEVKKSVYIHALLACGSDRKHARLALGSQGKPGSLLQRVDRMVTGRNSPGLTIHRGLAAIALLICVAVMTSYQPTYKYRKTDDEPGGTIADASRLAGSNVIDTLPSTSPFKKEKNNLLIPRLSTPAQTPDTTTLSLGKTVASEAYRPDSTFQNNYPYNSNININSGQSVVLKKVDVQLSSLPVVISEKITAALSVVDVNVDLKDLNNYSVNLNNVNVALDDFKLSTQQQHNLSNALKTLKKDSANVTSIPPNNVDVKPQ